MHATFHNAMFQTDAVSVARAFGCSCARRPSPRVGFFLQRAAKGARPFALLTNSAGSASQSPAVVHDRIPRGGMDGLALAQRGQSQPEGQQQPFICKERRSLRGFSLAAKPLTSRPLQGRLSFARLCPGL